MNVCTRCGRAASDPRALYCPIDGTPLGRHAASGGDPLIGKHIDDRYLVLARIGDGGMATVYLARHLVLPRLVAIKLMHPELESSHVAWFKREAVAIARVASPHVAAVIDFGHAAALGRHYLAMEHVPGVALDTRLEQLGEPGAPGALSPELAVHVAAQIAHGLAAAHARGVLHRDVKPSNVLLTRVGPDPHFVKLVDFGIARALGPHPDPELPALTPGGEAPGSPEYMAPERFYDRAELDARADVYALGVTLFELLTGTVPFAGATQGEIRLLHLTQEPPPPSHRMQRWAIPASLDAVVLRCLQKEPEARYASMEELLVGLGQVWKDVAPPPELTPVVTYAGTGAAPGRGDGLDLTPYRSRDPDELLDAPALAEELARLVGIRMVRLDALLSGVWPGSLPAEIISARNEAAPAEGRLAEAASALARARERLGQHHEETQRRQADLRASLVLLHITRDEAPEARDGRRQLAEVERRLAVCMERDERETSRLEASLVDRTRELVEIVEALEPAHASLFEQHDHAGARQLVESIGEMVGAVTRCIGILRRLRDSDAPLSRS